MSAVGDFSYILFALTVLELFGFGTKFSERDGYHSRTRASQTQSQTPDDALQAFSLGA